MLLLPTPFVSIALFSVIGLVRSVLDNRPRPLFGLELVVSLPSTEARLAILVVLVYGLTGHENLSEFASPPCGCYAGPPIRIRGLSRACETTLPRASGCARSGYKEQKAPALRLGEGHRGSSR